MHILHIYCLFCISFAYYFTYYFAYFAFSIKCILCILKDQVLICIFNIFCILTIFSIFCMWCYNEYIFPSAGHSDRLMILKSAAFYALSDEDLEDILSCENEAVLESYLLSRLRVACRLWKCHASWCQVGVPDRGFSSTKRFSQAAGSSWPDTCSAHFRQVYWHKI